MALTADVLYAGDDVRVTRSMVTVGTASYPVAGISGIRVTSGCRPSRVAGAFALVFGLVAALAFARFAGVVVGLVTGEALTALFHLVVALLPVGVALRRIRDARTYVHTLWLRDRAGETPALVSRDVHVVGDVADAISRAAYGRR